MFFFHFSAVFRSWEMKCFSKQLQLFQETLKQSRNYLCFYLKQLFRELFLWYTAKLSLVFLKENNSSPFIHEKKSCFWPAHAIKKHPLDLFLEVRNVFFCLSGTPIRCALWRYGGLCAPVLWVIFTPWWSLLHTQRLTPWDLEPHGSSLIIPSLLLPTHWVGQPQSCVHTCDAGCSSSKIYTPAMLLSRRCGRSLNARCHRKSPVMKPPLPLFAWNLKSASTFYFEFHLRHSAATSQAQNVAESCARLKTYHCLLSCVSTLWTFLMESTTSYWNFSGSVLKWWPEPGQAISADQSEQIVAF